MCREQLRPITHLVLELPDNKEQLMSSIFRKPSSPKIPAPPEPIEEVQVLEEDAEKARQRERKKLVIGGRRSTILSGIEASLKKRLGE